MPPYDRHGVMVTLFDVCLKGRDAMTTVINLFRSAGDIRQFEAGAVIFREGEPGDLFYCLVEGEVEVRQGEKLLALLGPGELLGELALIDDGPRSASALAHTACALAPVDEQQFLFMVQHTPYFALDVMRVLVERLRQERSGVVPASALGSSLE
jgi:CRP/FNR family transcriptional regulator, cyclic AMP receptor protein